MSSKTLGFFLAAMAALQFIGAATNLADLTSPTAAAWVQLTVGALQAFSAVYVGKMALMPVDGQHPSNLTSNELRALASKAASSENAR